MIFLQHEKGWDNMLTKTRQKEILKLLENRGSVTLQELKDHLNTSESTIRRDLNTLDAQGKLVKVFGGAVAADNMSIRDEQVSRREEKNLEEKRLIARYAASLIQDDDFVYLDAGTTTGCMLDYISDTTTAVFVTNAPIMAIENLTATTLRNIIGDLELDQTLTSRETINTKMRASLDIATDPWGIKVNRVELKNIIPPAAIQDAMEKQMKAERERREAILRAEGEKKSTVLVAEGKKESAILDAEAEKTAAILRAEAQKEKMIREAEGQAEAILKVQKANADGLRFLKDAGADETVLALKSFEALTKVADGKATKIIIPSELQNVAGTLTALAETVKTEKKETADPV